MLAAVSVLAVLILVLVLILALILVLIAVLILVVLILILVVLVSILIVHICTSVILRLSAALVFVKCQDLSLALNTNDTISPHTIAAVIPPVVAFKPPINIPRKPSCATASFTPFASV